MSVTKNTYLQLTALKLFSKSIALTRINLTPSSTLLLEEEPLFQPVRLIPPSWQWEEYPRSAPCVNIYADVLSQTRLGEDQLRRFNKRCPANVAYTHVAQSLALLTQGCLPKKAAMRLDVSARMCCQGNQQLKMMGVLDGSARYQNWLFSLKKLLKNILQLSID